MRNAIFQKLTWEKGTASVSLRYNNNIPSNAKYGANGTYIVTTPAKMFLTIYTDDGRVVTKDIADTVRQINNWKNFSKQRFTQLNARLKNYNQFQIDENDDVIGLEAIVLI